MYPLFALYVVDYRQTMGCTQSTAVPTVPAVPRKAICIELKALQEPAVRCALRPSDVVYERPAFTTYCIIKGIDERGVYTVVTRNAREKNDKMYTTRWPLLDHIMADGAGDHDEVGLTFEHWERCKKVLRNYPAACAILHIDDRPEETTATTNQSENLKSGPPDMAI
jgi:hypothetical protein